MLKPPEPAPAVFPMPGTLAAPPQSPRKTTEMTSTNLERWSRVKQRLRAEVGDDIFSSWFARMDLDGLDDDVVRLSVPTRFLKSWIQAHYAERVLTCWRSEQPLVRRIEVSVRSAVLRNNCTKPKSERSEPARDGQYPMQSADHRHFMVPAATQQEALGGSPLDPRLSFDLFMVGRSNTLAHAAAKQVANARRGEAVMFNPLYIHAGVGLGKTHLLQAIAWAGNARNGRKVLYLTAERFMYGFVSALKTQTAIAFKEALRAIDVLVIDDLQFLQGKSTQAEFCHTLNALIDAGRQVVVAGDRPPADLESLDDRVRSRLAGGLVVEMGSHEEELRLEILKARVAVARQHHPGCAVRDLVRPQDPKRVRIEDIQRTVVRQYNVSRADLLSSRRTANVVRPRQIAMYLAKTLTLRSLPEIGRRFGGRDHTTVLHAVRKIETLVGNDAALAEEIELLKRLLQE